MRRWSYVKTSMPSVSIKKFSFSSACKNLVNTCANFYMKRNEHKCFKLVKTTRDDILIEIYTALLNLDYE